MSAVLGLAPWRYSEKSADVIQSVLAIIEEYRSYLPITGRQLFYRMVGNHDFPKTEKAYKRLLSLVNRARRAGLIPFSAIRDDGVTARVPYFDGSPERLIARLIASAEYYRLDQQRGQQQFIELWCEAEGMVPQMQAVADFFGIPVYSSGGFNSTTMKHDAAKRMLSRFAGSRKNGGTLVLHVGDHDPSGVAIFENLAADIPAFITDLYCQAIESTQGEEVRLSERRWVASAVSRWERIAVTERQVRLYDLDTAPPKRSDSRSRNWQGSTVQVEAMTPDQLASEVRAAIEKYFDRSIHQELVRHQDQERKVIAPKIRSALEDLV